MVEQEKKAPSLKGAITMASSRRAVIDIGSNSVRLVVYDGARRAPLPICNEKALCGLGRDMSDDGSLDEGAIEYALETLSRFSHLLSAHGDPQTTVIATAAVREAKNGADFVRRAKAIGFKIDVIEGAQEAQLAAQGVLSMIPSARGLVGDMGGGSLELTSIANGKLLEGTSLSIGPLRLMQQFGGDLRKSRQLIDQELEQVEFLKSGKFDALYSVGGAWRAVARIHMRLKSYPLPVLHQYELSAEDAIEICELVARQSRKSLEDIPGIPRRRIDTLPFAATVLGAVLQRTGVRKVVVSAGGVREGLLYEDLNKKARVKDPLLIGCDFFADKLSPESTFGAAVSDLTAPLFGDESEDQKRIRIAICKMIDIGAYFHPDLRAIQAFDTALRAPLFAISHPERVMMALALYYRHEGKRVNFVEEQVVGLLSWEQQQYAIRLGLALRFAGAFSPKVSAPLLGCTLQIKNNSLLFSAPKNCRDLMGEVPRKRLSALAAAYELDAKEEYL